MTQPKDGYGAAVEYFTEKPKEIAEAWGTPRGHEFGFIFRFMIVGEVGGVDCGCPSLVHSNIYLSAEGPNKEEINALCREEFLPGDSGIFPEHLPAFARVQRFADEKIPGRTVPKLVDGKWKLVKP